MEYLKFLIGSEKSSKFYASKDQIEILRENLVILSRVGSKEISDLSNEILKQFENISFNDEKFKKIQFNFFSGFDSLIQKIQNFGLVN